jgi:hypothetical protein
MNKRGGKKYVPPRLRKKTSTKKIAKAVRKEVKRDVSRVTLGAGIPMNRPMFLKSRPMMPKIKKATKGRLMIADREFIGSVTVTNSQSMGDHLVRTVLAPQNLTGTRLQVFSRLYEKYRFRKAVIHYVPMVGSTTVGTIIGFVDVDVADQPPTGTLSVRCAESATGSQMHHVFQKGQYRLPQNEGNQQFFFTDNTAEERLSQQGMIDIVGVSPFTSAATLGFLYLEYEIEFKVSHTVTNGGAHMFTQYTSSGTVSSSAPLGTPVQTTNADFSLSFSSDHLFFPSPGTYFIVYMISGTVACDVDFEAVQGAVLGFETEANSTGTKIIYAYVTISDATTDAVDIILTSGSGTQSSKIFVAECNAIPAVTLEKEDEISLLRKRLEELELRFSTPRSNSGLKSPLNNK